MTGSHSGAPTNNVTSAKLLITHRASQNDRSLHCLHSNRTDIRHTETLAEEFHGNYLRKRTQKRNRKWRGQSAMTLGKTQPVSWGRGHYRCARLRTMTATDAATVDSMVDCDAEFYTVRQKFRATAWNFNAKLCRLIARIGQAAF